MTKIPDNEYPVYGPPVPPRLKQALVDTIMESGRYQKIPRKGKITVKVLFDFDDPDVIQGVQIE